MFQRLTEWRSVTVAILCLKGSFMKSFELVHPLPIFILEKKFKCQPGKDFAN